MKLQALLITVIAFFTVIPQSQAGLITVVADQVSYLYYPQDGVLGAYSNTFIESSSGISFTQDFAVDKILTLRIEAPSGKRYVVSPPAGFDVSRDIVGAVDSSTGLQFPVTKATGTFVFEGLFGTSPVGLINEFFGSTIVDAYFMQFQGYFSSEFSFTAFEASVIVPNDFNVAFVNDTLSGPYLSFSATAPYDFSGPGPADPGPFITIVDATVPEPATFALLSLGIAGFGFSRKRKQAVSDLTHKL